MGVRGGNIMDGSSRQEHLVPSHFCIRIVYSEQEEVEDELMLMLMLMLMFF